MNDASAIRNRAHIDSKDEILDNVRFVKVNSMPDVGEHLTAKYYVDRAISNTVDELTSIRNNLDNDFNHFILTKLNRITLNNQSVKENQVITNSFVDQLHQEKRRCRQDLGIDFSDESNGLVKITKLIALTILH